MRSTVIDGFEDSDLIARYQGKQAVMIYVFGIGEQNALKISDDVNQYIDELRARVRLPERYVLHVGTNKPHKNLERLIAAWSEVHSRERSECCIFEASQRFDPGSGPR